MLFHPDNVKNPQLLAKTAVVSFSQIRKWGPLPISLLYLQEMQLEEILHPPVMNSG